MTPMWRVNKPGEYSPCGPTANTLAAGMYVPSIDYNGNWFLKHQELTTDDLVVLDDSASQQVVANVRRFWTAKETFKQLGLVHKRGVLLYGAPGCGKTATAEILAKDVITNDGVVLLPDNAYQAEEGIKMVRAVEPNCKVVVILEDVDELIKRPDDESGLSNLLDGENQVDNVVYLATTNFIDKIPPRFRNRPSRFDEVLEIKLPNAATRSAYLRAKVPPFFLIDGQLDQWVTDTNGLGLAHLRELIVGVLALGRPYTEVLDRLRVMTSAADAACGE